MMASFTSFLSNLTQPVYSLLRFFSGFLFAFHGAQKLFGVFGGEQASDALMIVAGIVEFFGGLAIAVGLLTHVVAFLCAGEMAVAYLIAHLPNGMIPIQNQGELALLYMFIFLYIMTRGPGILSVDQAFGGKPSTPHPSSQP